VNREQLKSQPIPKRFAAVPIEQLMRIVHILHDGNIRCVIKFSGRIDAQRLTRSVRLSLDAEPILGCCFIDHKWRPYWQRIDGIEEHNICTVVRASDSEKERLEFMADPIDPVSSPQVRVGLFRSKDDTLCIKLHHIAVDGIGTMEYAYLLSRIYRSLKENTDYSPVPNIRKNRGIGRILKNIPLLHILKGCCYFSYPRPVWSFPSTGRDQSGIRFATRRINSRQYERLKKFCKQSGISINDALLAAYYRAMVQIATVRENQSLPLEMPVNVRRHLSSGSEDSICNFTSAFYPFIRYHSYDGFKDILSKVRTTMEKGKKRESWIGSLVYLELVFGILGFSITKRLIQARISREMVSGKIHPVYVNVGIVDQDKLKFDDTVISDVDMFGPVPYPPASIFSVNTFQKTMVFTTAFCSSSVESKIVEEFLDRFIYELPIDV